MNRKSRMLLGGVLLLIVAVGPGIVIANAQEDAVAEAPAPEVEAPVKSAGSGALTVVDPTSRPTRCPRG